MFAQWIQIARARAVRVRARDWLAFLANKRASCAAVAALYDA